MSESDYEYEEESNYVLFDLGNSVSEQYISQISRADGGCRIIGLEEGKPYIQIGHQVFEGEIDDTIGTHMIFEIQESKRETSGLLPLLSSMRTESEQKEPKYTTTYFCSTDKMVACSNITLKQKNDEFDQINFITKSSAQKRPVDDEENEYL